jgi:hypothetical protein
MCTFRSQQAGGAEHADGGTYFRVKLVVNFARQWLKGTATQLIISLWGLLVLAVTHLAS